MDRVRWSAQAPGERVLRAWLGGTFTYAGLEKLTDPGFFTRGSSTYIGAQLDGFAQSSPIGPLLHLAGHAPVLAGAGVAVTEILVGVATLVGVGAGIAAAAGFGLTTTLWLSATFHVHPYFLGSDTIYAVAWLAYLLSLPSVAALLARARGRTADAGTPSEADERRRSLLVGGAVVASGLALGGVAALVGRARRNAPNASATTGAVVAKLATLKSDGSVDFTDPTVGSAVAVELADGTAVAFSRRCTHSGCTASYAKEQRLIVCPCHGSRFDPADGGKPVNGPATQPLTQVPVSVDPTAGVVRRA